MEITTYMIHKNGCEYDTAQAYTDNIIIVVNLTTNLLRDPL